MNFKEALYGVLDEKMPKIDGKENVINLEQAKILALLWSMIALSENVLDDIAYIDKTKEIVSIPLQKSTKAKKASTEKTAKKTAKNKAEKDDVVGSNGEKTGEPKAT